MKRYFKNLFLAIIGRNPFQMELEQLEEQYEKIARRVRFFEEIHLKLQEKMKDASKWVSDYQALVENLRSRLSDKDAELEQQRKDYNAWMERMRADYQKRIKDYNAKIDELQNPKAKP